MEKRLYIKALQSQFNFSIRITCKYSDLSIKSKYKSSSPDDSCTTISETSSSFSWNCWMSLHSPKRFLHLFSLFCVESSPFYQRISSFSCAVCVELLPNTLILTSCSCTFEQLLSSSIVCPLNTDIANL